MSDENRQNPILVNRTQQLRVFYDPALNPPGYVPEQLPTKTVILKHRGGRGLVKAPQGTTTGTYSFSGSYQPNAPPGTFSARVIRLNVSAGTPQVSWFLRHSRKGTLFAHTWGKGALGPLHLQGDLKRPVMVFGPGTVTYGFIGTGGQASIGSYHMVSQFIELITG